MDQLIYASLSDTHYWYEVGILKVPVVCNIKKYKYEWLAVFLLQ